MYSAGRAQVLAEPSALHGRVNFVTNMPKFTPRVSSGVSVLGARMNTTTYAAGS